MPRTKLGGLINIGVLLWNALSWGAGQDQYPLVSGAAGSNRFGAASKETSKPAPALVLPATGTGLEFIDTSFENASPLWYEIAPDGTVNVYLLYDHERSSPNRAAGHFHFLIQAKAGSQLTL